MRRVAAYLIAPAIWPIAALIYGYLFATPNEKDPIYVLFFVFYVYPGTFVIAVPTLRLVSQRSRFLLPALAASCLSLIPFALIIYGSGLTVIKSFALAGLAAVVGALTAILFVLFAGADQRTNESRSPLLKRIRDYLPYFSVFLAVIGGMHFGLFSCGGYAIVGQAFGAVFLGAVTVAALWGRAMLSSVIRRITFVVISFAILAVTKSFASTFYPAAPSSIHEFIRSFITAFTGGGPCY